MKRIIALILLALAWVAYCEAQTVVKRAAGEYFTADLNSNGTVTAASQQFFTPTTPPTEYTFPIDSIKMLAAGQYGGWAMDSAGKVWHLATPAGSAPTATLISVDDNGDPFTGNTKITDFYQAYVTIRNGDLWYGGIDWGGSPDDPMNYNGGAGAAPKQLSNPRSKTFIDVLCVANTGFNNGLTKIIGLADDGTVELYDRGNATPTEITISGKTITKIAACAFYGTAAYTSDNILYSLNTSPYDTRYLGASSHSTSLTDITSRWTNAGAVLPFKEIVGNQHALHIIDANDILFGAGSNTMGLVGIGSQRTPLQPDWEVDIAENSAMLEAPVKIDNAKVKNICGGQTIAFAKHVQDMADNWYSWGRNKGMSLRNGITLPPYGGDGYDSYPNAMDVLSPTNANPASWTLITGFNPLDSVPPNVGAGINQYISSTSATLNGKSFQQEHAIASVEWAQVAGKSCTITSPNNNTTTVTGLNNGTYVFRLTATNSNEQTSYDEVTVVVSGLSEPTNKIYCPCFLKP